MQHQAAHHGCPHPPSKAKLGESTSRSILPCMVGSVVKGRRVGFFVVMIRPCQVTGQPKLFVIRHCMWSRSFDPLTSQ